MHARTLYITLMVGADGRCLDPQGPGGRKSARSEISASGDRGRRLSCMMLLRRRVFRSFRIIDSCTSQKQRPSHHQGLCRLSYPVRQNPTAVLPILIISIKINSVYVLEKCILTALKYHATTRGLKYARVSAAVRPWFWNARIYGL